MIGFIIVGVILAGVLVFFGLKEKTRQAKEAQGFSYFNFPVPIKLDDQIVTNAKDSGEPVKLTGTNICEKTYSMAVLSDWEMVDEQNFTNGTFDTKFFLNKDNPVVDLSCVWNEKQKNYSDTTLTFTKVDKIGSWLLEIKKRKLINMDEFNVEELMGCVGTIVETKPGTTVCTPAG